MKKGPNKMAINLNLLLLCFVGFGCIEAANILAIYPLTVQSTLTFHEAMWTSLVDAGHHVTFITPLRNIAKPMKNYTVFDVRPSKTKMSTSFSSYDFKTMSSLQYVRLWTKIAERSCYNILEQPEVQDMLSGKGKKYDVMFIQVNYMYECYVPIAKKLCIPIIGTLSIRSSSPVDYKLGNPRNRAAFSYEYAYLPQKMSFYQRMQGTFLNIYADVIHYFVKTPTLDKFFREYYTTFDWRKDDDISLVFFNSHHSILPRPLVPNAIEIGGIHISNEANPLPQKLEDFINSSKDGAIVFSLGSMTHSGVVTPEMRNIFRDAFAEIPQRVIWKFEEEMNDLTDNVLQWDYIPQRDILAHKNVKAFITHCGIHGMQEGIYEGKPMILLPLFLDQPGNAALVNEKNAGIYLDFRTLTKKKLLSAIHAIINDTKYYKNTQELSRQFKDRPMSPQNSVVYWTEYIIRHKGASHLKTSAVDMPLYQYLLLDVILFVTLISVVLVYIGYYILRKIFLKIISITRNKEKCQ